MKDAKANENTGHFSFLVFGWVFCSSCFSLRSCIRFALGGPFPRAVCSSSEGSYHSTVSTPKVVSCVPLLVHCSMLTVTKKGQVPIVQQIFLRASIQYSSIHSCAVGQWTREAKKITPKHTAGRTNLHAVHSENKREKITCSTISKGPVPLSYNHKHTHIITFHFMFF